MDSGRSLIYRGKGRLNRVVCQNTNWYKWQFNIQFLRIVCQLRGMGRSVTLNQMSVDPLAVMVGDTSDPTSSIEGFLA